MKQVMEAIMADEKVKSVFAQLEREEERTLKEQMELCGIPSPSNMEEKRAARYLEFFQELPFDKVWQDQVGNVLGLIKGTGRGPKIVLAAHMDTVFGPEIDVTPWIDEKGVVHGPGIGDDTRGMAEVLTLARAFLENGLRPMGDLIFCGNVGEETLGNLRGSRHLFSVMGDIDGFVSIDGPEVEKLICHGTASVKYRVTYRGNGGHALGRFGIPNANNALGRAVSVIADIQVPKSPLTVFNVGVIKGGTSINGIPTESQMMIDMRSIDNGELEKVRAQVEKACLEACEKENARWAHPTERVTVEVEEIGRRPGGKQDMEIPMIQAAIAAYRAFGMEPAIPEGASTDSNIPISLGIPAITIGRSGAMSGGHTVNECFYPENASLGLKRDTALLLALAGLEGVCEPAVAKRR